MNKLLLSSVLVLSVTPAIAQDDIEKVVEVRQSMFTLFGNYIGPLGAMARGRMDYDSELAANAARSLAAVASIDKSSFFPPGSSLDDVEGTGAKPEIWADMDDVMSRFEALEVATETLASAAGESLDSLKQAVGEVGGTCKGCHDNYREDD